LLAREVISLRQNGALKAPGDDRAAEAGICKNVASVEATAAPRRLLLQLGRLRLSSTSESASRRRRVARAWTFATLREKSAGFR